MTDARPRVPREADERETLTAWLDYHRATLMMKCDGLSHEQLRERSVPPSSMSLLGLVRHMADVERGWFRRGVGGEKAPPHYYSDENPEGDFDDVDTADVDEAFAAWRDDVEQARAAAAAVPSLDHVVGTGGGRCSVRWIMTHMIEEYARHNGHADLLRERIDGAVGD